MANLVSGGIRSPRANGHANKLLFEDRPVHSWYRFVLSFPPHLVRDYLDRFDAGAGQTDLFRTRLATATRQQLREEVVLLRWPGD